MKLTRGAMYLGYSRVSALDQKLLVLGGAR